MNGMAWLTVNPQDGFIGAGHDVARLLIARRALPGSGIARPRVPQKTRRLKGRTKQQLRRGVPQAGQTRWAQARLARNQILWTQSRTIGGAELGR